MKINIGIARENRIQTATHVALAIDIRIRDVKKRDSSLSEPQASTFGPIFQ
jgi:hypothetical protein